MSFDELLGARNHELRKGGLWRELEPKAQGRLNFTTNDYLGLRDEAVELLFGGSGSSRLVSGTCDDALRLEGELAAYTGHDASLVFGSGYLANVGALQAIGRALPDLTIFSDELNHASIVDGCRLSKRDVKVYAHLDVEEVEAMLTEASGSKLVVTESVFSMEGDIAPLVRLQEVCHKYGAYLMVDEAHSGGIWGDGHGLCHELGVKPEIHVGTLSKAYGWFGGYVAGGREFVDYLRHAARGFVYTTALPRGFYLGARLALDKVMRASQARRQLFENLAFLGEKLDREVTSPVLSFRVDNPVDSACVLVEKGALVQSIRYPTVPRGTERLRISVSAAHSEADLEDLVRYLGSLGLI